MSWIEGARRNYAPSLVIRDEMVAHVEFLEEPQRRNFGKKKTLKGDEVDDIRVHSDIKYLGGNSLIKGSDNLAMPAIIGTTYTLWLSSTLIGAIAEGFAYKDGDPVPKLAGSKWKVYRGEYGRGGHRVYKAEPLSSDFGGQPTVTPPKPEEKPIDEEAVMLSLKAALDNIGTIDIDTWSVFVQSKGVKAADVLALTKKMQEKGYLDADATKVTKK